MLTWALVWFAVQSLRAKADVKLGITPTLAIIGDVAIFYFIACAVTGYKP